MVKTRKFPKRLWITACNDEDTQYFSVNASLQEAGDEAASNQNDNRCAVYQLVETGTLKVNVEFVKQ